MRLKRVPAGVLALILWIGTLLVGLWEIVIIRDMLFRIYARLGGVTDVHDTIYWAAVSMGHWSVLVMGLAWLALAIGTGEYHYKRVGQRSSWRLFGWTIGVELVILLLALVV